MSSPRIAASPIRSGPEGHYRVGRGLPAAGRGRLARLGRDEALDEIERGLRHLLPAVVDRE
jgi:hypothetical protein